MSVSSEVEKKQELEQKIGAIWGVPEKRDGRWGKIFKAVTIEKVRGIQTATIKFNWPITVIAGSNRSGKTTILQCCSMGYNSRHYKNIKSNDINYFDAPFTGSLPPLPGYRELVSHIGIRHWTMLLKDETLNFKEQITLND